MRKSSIYIAFQVAFLALCVALASCASNSGATDNHEPKIVEWKDMQLGQVEKPTWVLQLKWGNDRPFKEAFGLEYSRVCRIGAGTAVLLEQAQELSRLDAARKIAVEMQQTIIAKTAAQLSDEQLKIINDAMTSASVQLSGLREEEQHWWKVQRYDEKAKRYYDEYECFTAYSIAKDIWDEAAKKYLLDVMSANGVEEGSQEILGASYSTLQESAHRDDEATYNSEKEAARSQLSRLGEDAVESFDSRDSLSSLLK